MKKFSHIVYIGRFNPCHVGHLYTINKALELSEKVIILIGSAHQPRTFKNPWLWHERKAMIISMLSDEIAQRIVFLPLDDVLYNEAQWLINVQSKVASVVPTGRGISSTIGIIGADKDDTSYYLHSFPQWETVLIKEVELKHATNVRAAYFEYGIIPQGDYLHPNVSQSLSRFQSSTEYKQLKDEYTFNQNYIKAWSAAPHPVSFNTVDAVVFCMGHVLNITRKSLPGKGLMALPGGFINHNETIETAVFRELAEETKIKIPLPVLKGNVVDTHTFDAPYRSLRGRTFTFAYCINLPQQPNGKLPKVKGSDDAKKAFWTPLHEVQSLQDRYFEDHMHIINYFVGKLKEK